MGENLQDHIGTMIGPFLIKEPDVSINLETLFLKLSTTTDYIFSRTGPMTSSGVDGVLFDKFQVQHHFISIPLHVEYGVHYRKNFNIREKVNYQ